MRNVSNQNGNSQNVQFFRVDLGIENHGIRFNWQKEFVYTQALFEIQLVPQGRGE